MTKSQEKLPQTLFAFIWHFLREFKLVVIVFIFLAITAGFWAPFNSILIKQLINLLPGVKKGNNAALSLAVILIILNFIIFNNFTWRGITYIRSRFTPLLINRIISETMNYVLDHSHQFFQSNLSGKISKQIKNLGDGIEEITTSVAFNFLRGASLLITAFITAYFVNPVFCSILVIWLLFFSGTSIFMSKKFVTLSDTQAETESIVVGELVDTVSNQNNVRVFARKAYENLRMSRYLTFYQKAYRNTYFYAFIMHTIQGGLIALMMIFSAYFLVRLYKENLVTIGDFALIFGLATEAGCMVWFLMAQVDTFNQEVGRCKQSLLTLIKPKKIKDTPCVKKLECPKGKIEFHNVEFYYRNTQPFFQNKSLCIEAGEKVGLVGHSGSGKSTFINLILRLYDIASGKILIDGQNIQEVTQSSLYQNIALISQEPLLFQRSFMENIRYGNIEASDSEVIAAAKKAHAHEYIIQLPKGYNTLVGERGIKISGGQRQRIAIARAILKNAPILLLDEATSQLDSLTEALIQEAIWHLIEDKTAIIIAHRLSTLLKVDRILVFDEGKVVEQGAHHELLSQNGLYKKLWHAQTSGFLDDKIASA